MTPIKPCNTCNEIKPLNQFYEGKGYRDGYRNQCKLCWSIRASNKFKNRYKNDENYRNHILEKGKTWRQNHKEETKKWRDENREKRKQYMKEYRLVNYEKLKI